MPSDTKIIVRVLGGLGNQLFIYAFARALSLKYNIPVYLETRTGFVKDKYRRKYKLRYFNIQLKKCSLLDSLFFPLNKRIKRLTKLIFRNASYFTEQNFNIETFDKSFITTKRIYIDGYWQQEKYFTEYEEVIRNELTVKFQITEQNKTIAKEMKNCNSVMIHVRRIQYNNLLGLDYYESAILQIKKQVDNPMFYVFSDDIEWCKKAFKKRTNFIFATHNNGDEVSEIWLMSQCKHFIIANSSFSWWGAWLNENEIKIIIIPNS